MKIKKILPVLLLLNLLPVIVLANGPIDCCKLRKAIEFEDVTYSQNIWVGEKSCDDGTATPPISVDCAGSSQTSNCYTSKWGLLCLLNTISTITDWVFYIMVVITSLLVIFGAFTISTAGGDPAKVATGRNYILYAMIGLIIGLLSRAIPALVQGLL